MAKMENQDFHLKQHLGYDPEEWTVLDKDEIKAYSGISGFVNNCFKIWHKKAVEDLGKGSYACRISWLKENEANKAQIEQQQVDDDFAAFNVDDQQAPAQQEENKAEEQQLPVQKEEATTIEKEELACRICGCTENDCRQCVDKTGKTCSWIHSEGEKPLCSACGEEIYKERIGKLMDCCSVAGETLSDKELFRDTITKETVSIKDLNSIPEPEFQSRLKEFKANIAESKRLEQEETQKVVEEQSQEMKPAEQVKEIEVKTEEVQTQGEKETPWPGDHQEAQQATEKLETKKVSTGGFFDKLCGFGFQQLNFTLQRLDNDKITVVMNPKNFSGDPAYDELSPLTLTGTVEEMDAEFFKAITPVVEKRAGIMADAKKFIDELEAAEKKSKKEKAKKDEIKKLVEAAKKYHDVKDFDASNSSKKNTAKKKWEAVLELDPENKDALDGLETLRKQIQ